jgi:hypothetical protein
LINSDKDYRPIEFSPPEFDAKAAKKSLNGEAGVTFWRWVIAISAVLVATDLKGLGAFCIAVSLVMLGKSHLKRWSLMKERRKRHEALVVEARGKHEETEALRKWRADMAPALREVQNTQNAEPLVELLTEELANEDLPVPLVFEIEFDDIDSVTIDLTLPDTEELPDERLSLTARGKLSKKAMTQRDRRSIYGALCCGLSLRLVHEAFRVVPSLTQVEIKGFTEVKDPATGHDREIAPLKLRVARQQIEALNLDEIDPEVALEGLEGRFNCSSRLELKEAVSASVGA